MSDVSILNIVKNKTWKDEKYQLNPERIDKYANRVISRSEATFLYQEYKKTKKKYGFFKFHAKRLGVSEEVLSEVSRGLRVDGFYFDGTKD